MNLLFIEWDRAGVFVCLWKRKADWWYLPNLVKSLVQQAGVYPEDKWVRKVASIIQIAVIRVVAVHVGYPGTHEPVRSVGFELLYG